VVDSLLIQPNKQVLLHIHEDSTSATIGFQSSIHVQRISGDEYSSLRQSALTLGDKVKALCRRNSVRDKKPLSMYAVILVCLMDLMGQCIRLECM